MVDGLPVIRAWYFFAASVPISAYGDQIAEFLLKASVCACLDSASASRAAAVAFFTDLALFEPPISPPTALNSPREFSFHFLYAEFSTKMLSRKTYSRQLH